MRHAILVLFATALVACAARATRPPDVSGYLADVVIRSAFDDGVVPAAFAGRVLLDSISFGRLGVIVAGRPLDEATVRPQTGVRAELVDPEDVLECPAREPCRLRHGGVYVTVWDAVLERDRLNVLVTRTWNIERLYPMTTSVAHRLTLARIGSGWRLAARQRLPT